MASDYTRCLWPFAHTPRGICQSGSYGSLALYAVKFSVKKKTVSMAGDYTRCLWPVTTHDVYGR